MSGATGYTVYRDGTRVTAVTGTSATVTGLAANTSYSFQVAAANAAGESAKSAAVSVRTREDGGNEGGDLPRHAVTGYWQNFNNGAAVQKISDVPNQYDIIAVAFADATGTRAPSPSTWTRRAWAATPSTSSRRTSAPSRRPARRSSSRWAASGAPSR